MACTGHANDLERPRGTGGVGVSQTNGFQPTRTPA